MTDPSVARLSEPSAALVASPAIALDGHHERTARRVIAVSLLAEEMPRTEAAALELADQVLDYLRGAGYVVVRDDLALSAYQAGKADAAMFGTTGDHR